MSPIVAATLLFGVTGLACGAVLAIAARFLAVREDPRVEALCRILPGYNCGSCGFGGCGDYANAIVLDGKPVNLCKPGGAEILSKIAEFMGVEAKIEERCVALVLCNGDDKVAAVRAVYNGVADCAAAELASGGPKACRYGCLGLGSCARVCPVNAIEITAAKLAVVHHELCIACGKCVAACPRRLIKLVPEGRSVHVLCSSKDKGPAVRKICSVGCIGCGICAKIVGQKGIKLEGPLAVVDYAQELDNEEVIAKCPQHTIVRRSGRKEAKVAA